SPFTAGWLRPVILFPAALLEELNEAQLRTILAHELAHVKRYDFLVNLSQTLLCILFFYHPAVWWMSARVEEEREHCCDDLAIAVTGEKVGYAKTLLQLKETEISGGRLAMNLKGNGKGFAFRVKRLLGNGLGTGTYGEGFTTAVIIAACIGLALNLSGQDQGAQPRVQGEDQMSELSSPPPPPPPPAPIAPVSPDEAEEVRDAIRLEAQRQVRGEATSGGKFLLFMNAIYEGEQEMVAYMLENEDLDLNQTDEHDFTPLMAAASENHTTILKMLIDAGADVNHLNGQGWTALIEAADEGSYETAEFLLKNGAD
ncbi:MAG: M56 family metallopeptidase, partial [Bacteroidota bacterium]